MLGIGIGIGVGPFGEGIRPLEQQISGLFSSGEQGAWFDPSDIATLYQDSAGTTPVTAVTNPVGLVLDKHASDGRGVVNLLTYSEQFDNAVWTKSGVSLTANAATAPNGQTTAERIAVTTAYSEHNVYPLGGISVTANVTHTMSVYVKKDTARFACLWMYMGSGGPYATYDLDSQTMVSYGVVSASGTFISSSIEDAGSGWFRLSLTASGNYTNIIPAIDIRTASSLTPGTQYTGNGTDAIFVWGAQFEVGTTATTYQPNTATLGGPGNHAIQATAAARPTWTNRVNLLTYSEQFDNAAWNKNNNGGTGNPAVTPNILTAPDGTLTGDSVSFKTSTGSLNAIYQYHTAFIGNRTGKISLRSISGATTIYLTTQDDSGGHFITTCNLTPQWQEFQVSGFIANATTQSLMIGWYTNSGTPVGPSVDTVIGVWGAQLELGSTSTRYQRVTTATDFDTVGFPYYLSFLGTDDSLSSATGGGGSAGFFWCGVVQLQAAGTDRTLWADNVGVNGYAVRVTAANVLRLYAGDGGGFTTLDSTTPVNAGTKYLLTVFDDGVNLSVQVGDTTPVTVARPVVTSSGATNYTVGKNHNDPSAFMVGNLYPSVYFRDTAGTAAERAVAQDYCRAMGGM